MRGTEKNTEVNERNRRDGRSGQEGRNKKENLQIYTKYEMSVKEYSIAVAEYVLLDLSISFLFFNSAIVFLFLFPGILWFLREQKNQYLKKRSEQMKKQFLDGMQLVSSSLQAGYSVENAFREATAELGKIYSQDAFIRKEFQIISVQMEVNRSIEYLLMDLGKRSGIDDIRSFAEMFLISKRTGGDLMRVIRNTVSCIRQKEETLREIETCISGKIMEQNIMSMVPIMILAYVRLTSPEFLEGMYGNITGTAVMGICLLIYFTAYVWGRQIVRIEV